MLEAIRTLYDYNAWANTRILDTAARLDAAQFVAEHEGAGSIRDLLVHTASAQWVWLERWQGVSPPEMWHPASFPDVATLRERWEPVQATSQRYLDGLTAKDLDRVVSYINFQGERWAYPLWQQMMDQINHATQHRSEVALLLTRAGHSPGDLDFLIYQDELAATN